MSKLSLFLEDTCSLIWNVGSAHQNCSHPSYFEKMIAEIPINRPELQATTIIYINNPHLLSAYETNVQSKEIHT